MIEEHIDIDLDGVQFAGEFDYDQYGLITNPGKFEREPVYVPYYWTIAMHGGSDETLFQGETFFELFSVTPIEKVFFPDLKEVKTVMIWADSQGFAHCGLDEDIEELKASILEDDECWLDDYEDIDD